MPGGPRGTVRERTPGVWELRVRTGRDPLTGEYRQVSRTFRGGHRQAESALVALSAEVADGRFVGTARTVSVLLEQWAEHLEAMGQPEDDRRLRLGDATRGSRSDQRADRLIHPIAPQNGFGDPGEG
jgi:hypothetical protein